MVASLLLRRLFRSRPVGIASSISRRALSTPVPEVPESVMAGEEKSYDRITRTESIVSYYSVAYRKRWMYCCYSTLARINL